MVDDSFPFTPFAAPCLFFCLKGFQRGSEDSHLVPHFLLGRFISRVSDPFARKVMVFVQYKAN